MTVRPKNYSLLNLVVYSIATFASFAVQAITPLDKPIEISQCAKGMRYLEYKAARPWYGKNRKELARVDTRILEVNDFHTAIGKKNPIPDSIFESNSTSTVSFDLNSPRGFIWQARDINWRSQMGTKVTMSFKDNDKLTKVDEVVTGSEYLRGIELEAVQEVVSALITHESDSGSAQAGIIMALSTDGVVSSETFGVDDDEEFNFQIAKKEMLKFNENVRGVGDGRILKIVYARTLIGRGRPLDVDDVKFLNTLIEMNPGAQIKVIGVPSEDLGYVAFEMRSP
jgi:hypothetical protein